MTSRDQTSAGATSDSSTVDVPGSGNRAPEAEAPGTSTAEAQGSRGPGTTVPDEERWLVIHGRRWRRTDPSLPADLIEALTSHLGRGRSGVRAGKKAGDDERVSASRRRVGLAKAGLGERGPYWWDEPEAARLARARDALRELEALDDPEASA